MAKKYHILLSIALLSLANPALAQLQPIDINNPSFEYRVDGIRICNNTVIDDVMAWRQNCGLGLPGVDVFCPNATNDHCHRWPASDGVAYCYIQNTGACVYQVLDMNNSDANAVIAAERKYVLTVDSIGWNEDELTIELFFVQDINYPDTNHITLLSKTRPHVYIQRPLEDCRGHSAIDDPTKCPDWNYDEKIQFVSMAGRPYIGKTLGVKFTAESPGGYSFIDNIRLSWGWATTAYDPDPEDKADNVSRTRVLTWKPGNYVADSNGHQVYLGTDFDDVNDADTADTTGIYRGAIDTNSYDAPEHPFALGKTYYWRVDQVNDAYSGTQPPPGPWKGDVWSFTVTGYATNPHPPNYATNVSPELVVLSWMAGTEATAHAVYFGTSADSLVYKTTLPMPTVSYYLDESPTLGQIYYWRIDAKNAASTLKGRIWSFTVAPFNLVDDFESYANTASMEAAWNDYWYGPGHTNHGYVFLNTDANFSRDGNSMIFTYNNSAGHSGKYYGSWTDGLISKIPVGNDWTAGGVKALVLYFYGKAGNSKTIYDRMYVKLTDVSAHTGALLYSDMNDVAEAEWHEWNIDLADPAFSSVVKTNISKITVGFGGYIVGQSKTGGKGTMYFDDIRLWPPRCRPELPNVTDFDDDCITGYTDLSIMANDWLFTEGPITIENRNATVYGGATWTTGHINGALQFDGVDDYAQVLDPRLYGISSMSITAWIRQTIKNEWGGIVSSRESPCQGLGEATELFYSDAPYSGYLGLGYDWSCLPDVWQHEFGLYVPTDGTWTFCALVVDPTGASMYMRPAGSALQTGVRNVLAHPVQQNFAQSFWVGRSREDAGYFVGAIDDVRIYDYNLSFTDVCDLAYQTADPNPWPVYHYKFDETSGTIAVDFGLGTIGYPPVDSPANIVDPEPPGSRIVNFMDFAVLADNWLEEVLWP